MTPIAWGLIQFFFKRLKYTKLNRIKVSPYGFELGLSVSVNYINLRKVNKFRPDFSLDLIDTWPEFLASSTFFFGAQTPSDLNFERDSQKIKRGLAWNYYHLYYWRQRRHSQVKHISSLALNFVFLLKTAYFFSDFQIQAFCLIFNVHNYYFFIIMKNPAKMSKST